MLGTWLWFRKGGPSLAVAEYAAAAYAFLRSSARRSKGDAAVGCRPAAAPSERARASRGGSARGGANLVVAALALLELDQPLALRMGEQLGEAAVAVIAFREIRIDALQGLLHDRAPQRIVLLLERRDRRREPLEGLALLVRHLRDLLRASPSRRLLLGDQIVVIDELVAARCEQIGRRAAHSAADHTLVVLFELRDERREVAIARQERECIDVRLRVAKIDRVDDHADVRAVLAARAGVRDIDHLEAEHVELAHKLLEPVPVAIRPLEHDPAALEKPLDDRLHLEPALVALLGAKREVLEIHEDRDSRL